MMDTHTASIPKSCDIVVIGGGPGGSSAATLLAKAGLDVVLFDKVKHPRPQVGESLIPHFWKFTEQLGVKQKILKDGFLTKAGGIIVWGGKIRQIRFSSFGYGATGGALHVERDRFDDILLRHAVECGARVYEEVTVRRVDFSGDRPVVSYDDRRGDSSNLGGIRCRYVIDASGPAAVLASQFNSRKLIREDGKFLGLWGYYKNANYVGADRKVHGPQDVHETKPVTFICSYEDGWSWHIILRDSTSVGLVMDTNRVKGKGKKEQEQYFRETCEQRIPYLRELLQPATFIEGSLFARPDYSYYSEQVCGDSFYCIGDAATFVDPIFSQGVTTAFYNAAVCTWALTGTLKSGRRQQFFNEVFRQKLFQYYGFSRLLVFGDFGKEGVDPELVKSIILAFPRNELELSLSAATTNNRSENLMRMVQEAGLLDEFGEEANKTEVISELDMVRV